mgnify:CR=1 FL=1
MSINLLWSELATYQNNKEAVINTQRGEFDAALTELYTITGDTSPTLTVKEFSRMVAIQTDGTQTATVTATIPQVKHFFLVDNTASSETCEIDKGLSTVSVAAGNAAILYSDGSQDGLTVLNEVVAIPTTYVATAYEDDVPTANKNVLLEVLPVAGDIPSGATGSEAYAAVASAANYDFDLKKNGVSFGTLTFSTGVNAGSFTVASLTSFSAGDRLTIEGAATPDTTLEDISFAILFE